MSGSTKGYRYITGLEGKVSSRHHSLGPALTFQRQNDHAPIIVYYLDPTAPISVGDPVPRTAVTSRGPL